MSGHDGTIQLLDGRSLNIRLGRIEVPEPYRDRALAYLALSIATGVEQAIEPHIVRRPARKKIVRTATGEIDEIVELAADPPKAQTARTLAARYALEYVRDLEAMEDEL